MGKRLNKSVFKHLMRMWLTRKVVLLAAIVILFLVVVAILAPLIAPHDPYKQDLSQILQQPSRKYLLGTDLYGRDLLSRIIYGTRTALEIGIIAVSLAAASGILLGLVAGYLSGWVDIVIMRCIDALMSMPPLVLALAIASVLGGGLENCILAVSVAMTPLFFRTTRGQVLSAKESDYVKAATVIGGSKGRIIFRHILPNIFPPIIVLATLQIGFAILIEAALSFLGVGIQPPGAAWGGMLRESYEYLFLHPRLSFVPGFCITVVVLSFNLVGDGIRDALDPKLRGVI